MVITANLTRNLTRNLSGILQSSKLPVALTLPHSASMIPAKHLHAICTRGSIRCLATAPSGTSAKAALSQALKNGPSLDDFISGDIPERVVLGHTKGYAQGNIWHLPLSSCHAQSTATVILEDSNPLWSFVQ